jgi:hypothetical protein
MRALALGTLLLAACTNAIVEDTGPNPEPFYPTALALSVRYSGSSVVTLSVTGVASAPNRHFGPYSVDARKVPSGGSIGLVFDPSDAGSAMACVSSIEDDGRVRNSDCTGFQIVASTVTKAQVDLTR